MCSDLVDVLPDASPGRRVDELPSGAVPQAFRPVALHVQGVRVESAVIALTYGRYHKKATLSARVGGSHGAGRAALP